MPPKKAPFWFKSEWIYSWRMGLVTSIQEPIFPQSQWSQHISFSQPIFSHCLSIVGKKMPTICVVARCHNRKDEAKGVSLLVIPFFKDERSEAKRRREGAVAFMFDLVFWRRTKWRFVWILITKLYFFFWWRHFTVLGKLHFIKTIRTT